MTFPTLSQFPRRIARLQLAIICVLAALAMAAPSSAFAQVSGKAFEGFSGNNRDPIQIEADELEVLDTSKKAIYRGRVKIRQGTSVITTDSLTVSYGGGSSGGQGNIERLDFKGNLVVTSGTNTATANNGTYWVKKEDVLLEGNVVISQGQNAAQGCKLTANLGTNIAKLQSCSKKKGGRVKTIIKPKKK